jgi:hypothetical protein
MLYPAAGGKFSFSSPSADSNAPPGGGSFPAWHLGPADTLKLEYFDELTGYFVEAARRLPLAEIPYLALCVTRGAVSVGLADPVTNILLTAIDAFARTEPYMMHPADIEQTKNKASFAVAARCSVEALIKFMKCYFRHLNGHQAELVLHKAGFDLRIAVEAVELHLSGGGPGHSQPRVADSARTKTAFEEAEYSLSRIMTSSYTHCMVEPVLEDLRRGEKITAACVYKLCEILRHPWSPPPPLSRPPPPPAPGTFRDSGGGLTHIICFGDDSFLTTRLSKDGSATATFTAAPPPPTYAAGSSEEATNLPSMFPVQHGADSPQATSLHVIRSHATSLHEIAHMRRVLAKK